MMCRFYQPTNEPAFVILCPKTHGLNSGKRVNLGKVTHDPRVALGPSKTQRRICLTPEQVRAFEANRAEQKAAA